MSSNVEINGVTLVPVKQAAAAVSYTRDYVGRLAREGKIVASQVGRQWFVDLESLRNFSRVSATHEAVRKTELRSERKRELVAKQRLTDLEYTTAKQIHGLRLESFTVAATALCLGLLVGFGAYTVSGIYSPSTPFSAYQATVIGQPEAVTDILLPASVPHETLLLTETIEQPVFTEEVRRLTLADTNGIMLFAQGTDEAEVMDVAGLFSDEVAVNFSGARQGTVEYQAASGEVSSYPFVLVPPASAGPLATDTLVLPEPR
jgi:hypothetical protein